MALDMAPSSASDDAPTDEGDRLARRRQGGARSTASLCQGQRVVLLEMRLSRDQTALELAPGWCPQEGHVVDPPTAACPFVTVSWDDGSVSTLHRGNLRALDAPEPALPRPRKERR
jgi:hypothetical protein